MKSTYLIRLPVLTCRRCILAHLRKVRLAGLGKGARLRRVICRKAAARRGVRKTVGARQGAPHRQEGRCAYRRVRKTVGRARVPQAVSNPGLAGSSGPRREAFGRGRSGVDLAHVFVELNLIAST